MIKRLLLAFLQRKDDADFRSTPPFILNKIAVLLSFVFAEEFPTSWASFFTDIIALCNTPVGADLFLRIMVQIDRLIADRDISRSQEESQKATALKDNMRAYAVADIAETWFAPSCFFTSFCRIPLSDFLCACAFFVLCVWLFLCLSLCLSL